MTNNKSSLLPPWPIKLFKTRSCLLLRTVYRIAKCGSFSEFKSTGDTIQLCKIDGANATISPTVFQKNFIFKLLFGLSALSLDMYFADTV